MAITLLRHATLSESDQGRYNGWTDLNIDPMHFNGKKIALLLKQNFDKIYCSDLMRCQETLVMMGLESYTTDERLREVRFRPHIEGLNFDEITRLPSYEKRYTQDQELWHSYICAENSAEFQQRIRHFLEDLPRDKEVLICSHGGTLQTMMKLLGYAKSNIAYLEWIRVENGLQ